jgi:hypothetical protein
VIDLLSDKIADVEAVVRAAITLMALIFVGMVWAKTKSFVPVVGALLLGALVIWGVNNVDFLEQKVGEEFDEGSLGPSTSVLPARTVVVKVPDVA